MTNRMFSLSRIAFVLICLVSLGACTHTDRMTARNIGVASAAGTAIGTVAMVASGGCIPCGAAIGLGVGAGTGLLYDRLDNRTVGR